MLGRLVDQGNTVLVIEHNLDVIKTADWLVDMGPEGGNRGGLVVAEGTPEEVAADPDSHTGQFLEPLLADSPAKQPPKRPRKKTAASQAATPSTGTRAARRRHRRGRPPRRRRPRRRRPRKKTTAKKGHGADASDLQPGGGALPADLQDVFRCRRTPLT